jgi:hypothetical protein
MSRVKSMDNVLEYIYIVLVMRPKHGCRAVAFTVGNPFPRYRREAASPCSSHKGMGGMLAYEGISGAGRMKTRARGFER